MAYTDDILALSPDHLWTFNNVLTDSVGAVTGTASGATLVSKTDLCEGNTSCLRTDAIAERVTVPSTTTISNSAQSRKAVGGWFQADRYQSPPKVIYAEGDTTNSFKIILGWGNRLVFEIDDNNTVFQIFGDVVLEPGRSYHLMLQFEGTAYSNILTAYLDGVSQLNAEPTNRIPSLSTLTAKTDAWFGDPASTVSVGGSEVILLAPINGSFANWATWSDKTLPTPTEVREELFEKGALPTVIITNQSGLDALADTLRADSPCCIRVTGDGTINLTADNITFSPLASIHVQYTGTGTLNWTNTNGSDASIGSTTNGGTLNLINPATLTVNSSPIGYLDGAEIRVYDNEVTTDSSYNTELIGVETNVGNTYTYSHSGTVNSIIVQVFKDGYEEEILTHSLSALDQDITLFPTAEENA